MMDRVLSVFGVGSASDTSAKGLYGRIAAVIQAEQKSLAADQELWVICSGPGGEILRVVSLGYFNPDMILMQCQGEDGAEIQVLKHTHSVSLALRRMRINPPAARCSIGFKGKCS